MLSPTSRSLERWWTTTHKIYRDLPPDLLAGLPIEVGEAITRLAQSVAADVHTHKRFWHNVPLVPVQGTAYETSLAFRDEQPIFLDWQRFGQGDAAYEIASACLTIERLSGTEAAQRFISVYMGDLDDPSFSTRIDICRRTLPFGRVLDVLKELATPEESEQDAVLVTAKIGHFLRLSMLTYGRDNAEADHLVASLGAWVGEHWGARGVAK